MGDTKCNKIRPAKNRGICQVFKSPTLAVARKTLNARTEETNLREEKGERGRQVLI